MQEEKFRLEGSPCQGYRFMPEDGHPRAVIHVVHGMAEHAVRYRRLAEALVADGWMVYAHDHRGHGATVTSDDDLGFFAERDGWSLVIDDLDRFVRHAREQHPGLPQVLFGHSMGGFIVQDYIARSGQGLAAAVLSGVAGPPPPVAQAGRLVVRVERWRQGARGRSPVMRELAFGAYNREFKPNRTSADWLSKDPKEVDKYVDDPKCGFDATNQMWLDLLDRLPAIHRAEHLGRIPKDLPIYIFAGDQDPVGRKGKGVQALAEALRAADVRRVDVKLYPTGRHEMLNEINREEVVADLKAWLAQAVLQAVPA